ILSDKTIREWIINGKLVVEPLDEMQIQPASIDLRLGNHYLKVAEHRSSTLDLINKPEYEEIIADEVVIPAHAFLLATTREFIGLPDDLTAFVEGRSSIGRLGLFIQNAGWVDPGFQGEITIELYNANSLPIRLKMGVRICQLVFAKLDKPAANPYRGKYQGQRKATGSRVREDIDIR
ncbi:MAG: dCTP deaminase, partial [bacterium]|nr:dCTP deaminase [bacterium]